jgi:hypothetical protein
VLVYDGSFDTIRDTAAAEQRLNDVGKDGWTLIACPQGGQCIFKK